ncbi:MAG TPA: DUF4239 domain-containing protein [Stellaceae bacterium]|nr:DUF4239 domain-containing protein [Stellaceae bacterium]
MSATWIAVLTFAFVFGGAMLGTFIRLRLPDGHLQDDSRDVVKVVVGLTATLAAVLFSLLIASAKNFYDAQTAEVEVLASKVVLLDRILAVYGPEAADARKEVRSIVAEAVERIWPSRPTEASDLNLLKGSHGTGAFFAQMAALEPHTGTQRTAQAQAIQIALSLSEIRVLMFSQRGNAVPELFLGVLLFWVVILFGGYGLLTQLNGTLVGVMFFSALSVGLAMYLIVEFNRPFDGVIRIPGRIMHEALAQMGQP